jgi:DNA-binding IclR family transcriptional regulator
MSEAVQSVERAASILTLVGAMGGKGARLADVVAATGLGKSTAHRLLAALVNCGLLDQDQDTRAYYLGYQLLALGEVAANRYGLGDLGMESIDRLAEATQDTVYLTARQGADAVCVARGVGAYPIKILTLAVGDRRPLGNGAGSLALLSFLPDAQRNAIIKGNAKRTEQDPRLQEQAVLKLVKSCRRKGYARTDGRVVPGMSSLGVPVLGSGDVAVAALSVAAISDRLGKDRSAMVLSLLREEAESLANRLQAAFGQVTQRIVRKVQER